VDGRRGALGGGVLAALIEQTWERIAHEPVGAKEALVETNAAVWLADLSDLDHEIQAIVTIGARVYAF